MSNDVLADLVASWRGDLGPEATSQDLADRVLDTVLSMSPDIARDLLRPVVLPWVRRREGERARVRDDEQRVFDPGAPKHGNPAQEAMRALLAGTCYVEGHGMVAWGQMTVQHHEIRLRFLERTRDAYVIGVNATIRRHWLANQLLTDNGYENLDAYVTVNGELPEELLEAEAGPVNTPA